MLRIARWVGVALGLMAPSACGGADVGAAAAPGGRAYVVVDARALDGSALAFGVRDGEIVDAAEMGDAPRWDAGGATIVPAFVDAHVHLTYDPVAAEHAAGGIAVAVDLASPIEALDAPRDPLLVLRAGPMITARGGYPLDSWGRDGYGVECDAPASCAAVVDTLVTRGVAVIKVPIERAGLDALALAAIVARAHALHRVVFAHALGAGDASRAADAGIDVLAHTPVEPIDDALAARFAGHAVVSTLAAFGGGSDAVANLARLRAHGVDVLYGTDLGNTRTTGIDPREIALLAAAGLDTNAIVEAATRTPARVLGLARHGELTPGHAASFLVYREDVHADATRLAHPDLVVLEGEPR